MFLPLQDEICPGEDDFVRIFRNNARISAAGIPQIAAIMGNFVAGSAYLPIMCDKVLMTQGSGLYIAGPSLVKAAIGQQIDSEELGGAELHAVSSGSVDFREKDDPACLARIRELAGRLGDFSRDPFQRVKEKSPLRPSEDIYRLMPLAPSQEYDVRRILNVFSTIMR